MEQDFQSHPSGVAPVCNVTIPVFNRPRATRETILALRRTSQEIPFDITVVDNGSDPALVESLLALRERGVIDHLFLLPATWAWPVPPMWAGKWCPRPCI